MQIGEIIGQLQIIKILGGGKVICKCLVASCGAEHAYNYAYLVANTQECKSCKMASSQASKTNDLRAKIAKLLEEEKLRLAGQASAVKIDKGAGKLWIDSTFLGNNSKYATLPRVVKITARYPGQVNTEMWLVGVTGKYRANSQMNADTAVYRCANPICEHIVEKTLKEATSGMAFNCPECFKRGKASSEEVGKIAEDQRVKDRAEAMKKQERAEREREIAAAKANEQAKKAEVKLMEKWEQRKEKALAENPNYKVYPIYTGTMIETMLVCDHCGSYQKLAPGKRKASECEGCKKRRKKGGQFYKGTYKRNYVGKVYNKMKITRQVEDKEKGMICDLECLGCGRITSEQSIIDVTERRVNCGCDKRSFTVVCPNCSTYNKVSYSTVKVPLKCSKCNISLSPNFLDSEATWEDRRLGASITGYKNMGSMQGQTRTNANTQLIQEKTPLYIGHNGEPYYRCVCVQCDTHLVLSDSEIANYDHNQCLDGRQYLYEHIDENKVSLK